MPAGSKILPYRSNIPYLSRFCFEVCDNTFPNRALEKNGGFIIGGSNYGQGSSREHAALVPLYLGVKAVIAKSFARIHRANLINSGIMPMTFKDESVYEKIEQGDVLSMKDIYIQVSNNLPIVVQNVTKGFDFTVEMDLSDRQRQMILAGGLLNFTKLSSK
jgi:aconitate hydratase